MSTGSAPRYRSVLIALHCFLQDGPEELIRAGGRCRRPRGCAGSARRAMPPLSRPRPGAADGRKINLAFAEHQMLVNAGPHVLDMDVRPAGPKRAIAWRSAARPGSANAPRRASTQTRGASSRPSNRAKLAMRVDQHARLGFEADDHILRRRHSPNTSASDSVSRSRPARVEPRRARTPDQSETQSLPKAAAMSIAPAEVDPPSPGLGSGETSVGSCLSRGSSRNRAPVSITERSATVRRAAATARSRPPDCRGRKEAARDRASGPRSDTRSRPVAPPPPGRDAQIRWCCSPKASE